MGTPVAMTVNGNAASADLDPRTLLVEFLRDHLRLTGTHVGCDTGQCGACTVHLNGRAVKACNIFAAQAHGGEVVTIEGIGADGELHPMQAAFRDHHGLQCGFCTPGVVMTLAALTQGNEKPSADDLLAALSGHICRCTGYHNIVTAVLAGAAAMKP